MSDDSDSGDDEDEPKSRAIINAEGSVSVTDLFGLGALAKSPAALKLVHELTTVFTDPLRTYLKGRAESKVEAKRRVELAKADQEVAVIQAETKLVERMGQRFVSEQVLKQTNLEKTLSLVVAELNEAIDDEPRNLDHTWLLRWMSGAQFASSRDIQFLWAKILASKSSAARQDVSHSALTILEHLDGDTAKTMQGVIEFIMVYGVLPWQDDEMRPRSINLEQMGLLKEIGVFHEAARQAFSFRDFDLTMVTGSLELGLLHDAMELTQRGYQLARALFDNDAFHTYLELKYDVDTKVATLLPFVRAMLNQTKERKVSLVFKNKAGARVAALRIMEGSTLVERNPEQLIQAIEGLGGIVTETAAKLIAILKQDYRNAGVSPFG